MLTSKAFGRLAKLLEALRAHEARIVDTLAEHQAPSRYKPANKVESSKSTGVEWQRLWRRQRPRQSPAEVLHALPRPRSPRSSTRASSTGTRALAARRGSGRDLRLQTRRLRVPFTFRVPAAVNGQEAEGEGWPASLASFPLGQWTADARRFYARGEMDEDRVTQLEKLGMIWSHFDVAWGRASRLRVGGLPRTGASWRRWTPPSSTATVLIVTRPQFW
ncbi:helicase associated domain-containing protein [Streptomyces albidoflavus]|uniref:helicase associated domain-containing protein n=1 Tax=Streptomyces albidoflavus TaxID=1886 RepID=UPI001F5C2E84|nr:helicase associated domain-containing protein [Streptomyces albidoflavus]